MSCLNLQLPTPPPIPPVFLALPGFNFQLSFGDIGVTCCAGLIPAFHIPVSIPSPGTTFAEIIQALNALIQAAMPTLDLIDIPNCPTNGSSL